MYNNFSSKKTKKVISALLASALVVTSAPTTASAATSKVLGVKKTFTVSGTKVTGLSKTEKKVVKVSIKNKKVTVKGLKAGKVSFKIGKKSYSVTVVNTTIKNHGAITLTEGQSKAVNFTVKNGAKDTIKFSSSDKAIAKVSSKATASTKAKATVEAIKEGTATITAKSVATGKTATMKVTVVKAAEATATPTAGEVTATPTAGEVTATPTAGEVTATPEVATATAIPTVAPTETPAVTTVAAIEAKQIGEKKFTVSNPVAFSKADVVVKRGNTTITPDSIVMDDNLTTATVTLSGSIVEVEYTVSVGENTTKFNGEASVPTAIEVTSDFAPVVGNIGEDTTEAKTAVANYKVVNQFGENITSKTSLSASTSASGVSLNSTEGTMTITFGTAPRLNDLVSVVLVYQNTGLTVSKVLTISTKAKAAEITPYGIYNADGKKLTATNAAKESFYYLFKVKDQYGNPMNKINMTDDLSVTVASGLTNVSLDNSTAQTIQVDGDNYLGFPVNVESGKVAVAGDVSVMIIPMGSGKTSTDTFKVGLGNTVQSLSVSVGAAVASGAKKNLDYVALDENGDEVKDYKTLKQVKTNSKKFYWIKEDGKVVLKFDDTKDSNWTTAGTSAIAVFTLPDYSTKTVTVNIKDASTVSTIVGFDGIETARRQNETFVITGGSIKVSDQYGENTKKASELSGLFMSTATGSAIQNGYNLAFMLVDEDSNNTITDVSGAALKAAYMDSATTDPAKAKDAYIIGLNDAITLQAKDKNGTENYTFKLVQKSTADGKYHDYIVSSSTGAKNNYTQVGAYTKTFTVTEDKKFTSYKVTTDKDVLLECNHSVFKTSANDVVERKSAAGNYTQTVNVWGVLSNGVEVKLTNGADYNIVAGTNVAVTGSAIMADHAWTSDAETTVDGSYSVVIKYNGATVKKDVKVSRTNVAVGSIAKADGKVLNYENVDSVSAAAITGALKLTDTYGKTATYIEEGKVTFDDGATANLTVTISDLESDTAKIEKNGTAAANVTGLQAGDSFIATYTCGSATLSLTYSIS